jgi:hypothetical protein
MNSPTAAGSALHPKPGAAGVHRLVPFVHVADVQASLGFYALLGFEAADVLKDGGVAFWALARSGTAEIMLARASGAIDAGQQAVLFYMYSNDVAGLRRHLLASGVSDGGAYSGKSEPHHGPNMVFAVSHPPHMPIGELRVTDLDGYVILVGQLG